MLSVLVSLKTFYVPDFVPLPPPPPPPPPCTPTQVKLYRNSKLYRTEIDMRKLLFLGRLVTEPKMAPLVRNFLRSRTESLFGKDVKSIGILPSICEALNKYDLFNYFEIWFNSSTFPTYGNWKSLSKMKFVTGRVSRGWNLFWSSKHTCCTSLLRKRLSIKILVLRRP